MLLRTGGSGGHSWEIDDNNEWGKLEEVLRRVNWLPEEAGRVSNSQLLKLYAGKEKEQGTG